MHIFALKCALLSRITKSTNHVTQNKTPHSQTDTYFTSTSPTGHSAGGFLTLTLGTLPLILLADEHVRIFWTLPLPASIHLTHCQHSCNIFISDKIILLATNFLSVIFHSLFNAIIAYNYDFHFSVLCRKFVWVFCTKDSDKLLTWMVIVQRCGFLWYFDNEKDN